MSFNDRVREKRKELGLSQSQLAKIVGIPQSTIGQIENGRNKTTAKILELAEALQTTVAYLMHGEESKNPPEAKNNEITDIHRPALWSSSDPLPEEEYVFTPYLKDTEFCGGSGSFEIPDYNGYRLPFGKSTLRRKGISPDNVFCCTLTGDSMEERIAEDAAIAVDTGETVIKDGKIYAFRHDDIFRVKYLIRQPGGRVKIRSHNPTYPDEDAGLDQITVIGRVFWWSVLD